MKEEYMARQQQQQQQQQIIIQQQYQQQQQQIAYQQQLMNNNGDYLAPSSHMVNDQTNGQQEQEQHEEETAGTSTTGEDDADGLNEKEEIFKLKCKLNEYEKQNSQLKVDTDRLNRRCTQLSMAEMQTTHELGNLKLKIQQMLDQYAELDRKFNDNLSKLKLYEQR